MNSKLVMTYAAFLYGVFGAGWLIVPNALGKFCHLFPDRCRQSLRRAGAGAEWLACLCHGITVVCGLGLGAVHQAGAGGIGVWLLQARIIKGNPPSRE